MKVLCCTASVCLALLCGSAGAQVCLSEVLYDPAGADDGAEIMELHNPTAATVDLSRWSICLNNPTVFADRFYYAFAAGRTIAPGAYLTVHWRASGAGDATNVFTSSEGTFLFGLGSATIDNAASAISLYEDSNANWTAIDFTNPALIRDFVQIGGPDLLREDVAVAAAIWINNDAVVDWPEGYSLVYDGTGDASSDYFGDPNGFLAGDNGIPVSAGNFTYGTTCGGSGGFHPLIPPVDQIPTDPAVGFQLSVVQGLGGATTLMVVGFSQISVPFGPGCELLASPDFFLGPFLLDNSGAGEGTLQLGGFNPIPNSGVTFFFTYLILDPGALQGNLIATNGLSLTF